MSLLASLEAIQSRNIPGYVNLLRDGCDVCEQMSGAEFVGVVAAVSDYLKRHHPDARRIGLVYPSGGFLIAPVLMGCLTAGCLISPMKIPKPRRDDDRASKVLRSADIDLVIIPSAYAATFEVFARSLDLDLTFLLHEDMMALPARALDIVTPLDQDQPVVLQFTSGSTSLPKGIQLNLEMIEANCRALAGALGVRRQAHLYNWMPFFHDFGLIFGLFLPVFLECRIYQVDPMVFVQDPNKCFRGLEKNAVTHAAFASFALAHSVEHAKVEVLDGLDLSRLHKLLVGADFVSPEHAEAFRTAFAPYGFSPDALVSGYGLAEATLAVTVGSGGMDTCIIKDQAWQGALPGGEVLDCGKPVEGVDVRIRSVAQPDQLLPEDEIGEIMISGPSVIDHYYGQKRGSEALYLDDISCFATGDIGFLSGGALYVCGRMKEILIVNGENFSPVLIEEICLDALGLKRAVYQASAFVFQRRGMDCLGIAIETPTDLRDESDIVRKRLAEAVFLATDLSLEQVHFYRKGTLPKTSSGKLMRCQIAGGWKHEERQNKGRELLKPENPRRSPDQYIRRESYRGS